MVLRQPSFGTNSLMLGPNILCEHVADSCWVWTFKHGRDHHSGRPNRQNTLKKIPWSPWLCPL